MIQIVILLLELHHGDLKNVTRQVCIPESPISGMLGSNLLFALVTLNQNLTFADLLKHPKGAKTPKAPKNGKKEKKVNVDN